jgi:hypothetical protein
MLAACHEGYEWNLRGRFIMPTAAGDASTEAFGSVAVETKPKRKLSAAARARIVAAQKARWAKIKAQQKK